MSATVKTWATTPPSAKADAALRKELVQVAAVAVAAIECLDRGTWKNK